MSTENLVNIIDSIDLPDIFTPEEEITLIETAYSLICDLLSNDLMRYIHPKFHDSIISEVVDLLSEQLNDIVTDDIEEDLTNCVEQALRIYYSKVSPKRSFNKTFIRIKPNCAKIREKIAYLNSVPQPEQRTHEWYAFRYKYLTASSIWKAFASESTRNQLICDKCKPFTIEKYSHTSMDSPMHWGHKYEPVSNQIYEFIYKTQISDFGCIPHKVLCFLAASPDGINTLETSDRYGRMLEIKNIVNREIDGIPKLEYWIQMQIQMEVCNLNECDFLETRFKEYADEDAYITDSAVTAGKDVDFCKTKLGQQKGMMVLFYVNKQPYYEYAPLNASKDILTKWTETIMEKHANDMWCKNIFWWLDELSCVLVLRNKAWFEAAVPILTDLWKIIEYEKSHGYEHRQPNKKIKVIKLNNNGMSNRCMFDLSTMDMDIDMNMGMNMDMNMGMNMDIDIIEDNININIDTDVF